VPVDGEDPVMKAGIRLSSAARLAYVTPARQAPLGFALSLQRRMRLLQWAAAVIFDDDYDGEYRYRAVLTQPY
jgi:GntR family transcriptional regulator / MocR family aminotransferase